MIYNLIITFPLFFTGRKLRPPGIGIEATVNVPPDTVWVISGTAFSGKIAHTHNKKNKKFNLYRKFNLYKTQNTKNDVNLKL